MANVIYKFGTEAQILALTPEDESWVEQAFYWPTDKDYSYQIFDGVMRKKGGGEGSSVGVKLNSQTFGGVKTLIEVNDVLDIPENYDYNTFSLGVEGVINCSGQINII